MTGQRGRSIECLLLVVAVLDDFIIISCEGHQPIFLQMVLYCSAGPALLILKSKLIHLLNKLSTIEPLSQEGELPEDGMDTTQDVPSCKMALVDGMVLLQQMTKKLASIVTVKDLSECFNNRLMSLTRDYDEIILVFDTYRDTYRLFPGECYQG